MSDDVKKPRKTMSLVEKVDILNRLQAGERISAVARTMNVHETTIKRIKKKEQRIRHMVATGCSPSRKYVLRKKSSIMVKVEQELMLWYEECVKQKIRVTNLIMRRKAVQIYKAQKGTDSDDTSFRASEDWYLNLRKRYSFGERDDLVPEYKLINDLKIGLEEAKVPEYKLINAIDLKIGLAKAKELERYLMEVDPNARRVRRFQIDLEKCLASYRNASVECINQETKSGDDSDEDELMNLTLEVS